MNPSTEELIKHTEAIGQLAADLWGDLRDHVIDQQAEGGLPIDNLCEQMIIKAFNDYPTDQRLLAVNNELIRAGMSVGCENKRLLEAGEGVLEIVEIVSDRVCEHCHHHDPPQDCIEGGYTDPDEWCLVCAARAALAAYQEAAKPMTIKPLGN